ncbi:hypothetical protein ACFCZY_37015 [Streptomyces sp. NPDC056237]|uniref:hypothetical protein n=1 Tax=unclassified Streptomyces TaxID=2593676 RepID=UPI0035E35D31
MTTEGSQEYGKHKKFRQFVDCPRCGYTDFPPGQLNEEQTIETRTCEDCGTEVETEPFFTAPPGEATHTFDS